MQKPNVVDEMLLWWYGLNKHNTMPQLAEQLQVNLSTIHRWRRVNRIHMRNAKSIRLLGYKGDLS